MTTNYRQKYETQLKPKLLPIFMSTIWNQKIDKKVYKNPK
jgi:hypothetical protein